MQFFVRAHGAGDMYVRIDFPRHRYGGQQLAMSNDRYFKNKTRYHTHTKGINYSAIIDSDDH